jgi:hypothetical protein
MRGVVHDAALQFGHMTGEVGDEAQIPLPGASPPYAPVPLPQPLSQLAAIHACCSLPRNTRCQISVRVEERCGAVEATVYKIADLKSLANSVI